MTKSQLSVFGIIEFRVIKFFCSSTRVNTFLRAHLQILRQNSESRENSVLAKVQLKLVILWFFTRDSRIFTI